MSLIASIASFSLKMSTSRGTVISIVKNKYLYFGGLLYILASLLNIWILKQLPYSVVLPLGSICFIWTMFIAGIFLKEKIGIGKIIGVFLILSGVILIATS
jgi:drug/metabolite transporter (DMT)-like permease